MLTTTVIMDCSYISTDYKIDAGWSSLVARRDHNPKVVGSNPAPATNLKINQPRAGFFGSEIYEWLEDGDQNGRRARRPRSNPAPATNLKINQPRAGFFGPEIYEWPENDDQNGRRARRPRSNPAPATNLKIHQPRAGLLGLKFINCSRTVIRTAVELGAPDRILPRNQFQG